MIYGYARCSTSESKQDINRQVKELKAAGAEEIYLEYEHGDKKIKPQQQQMLDQAQAGDTIITLEVSRLARSTQQLCDNRNEFSGFQMGGTGTHSGTPITPTAKKSSSRKYICPCCGTSIRATKKVNIGCLDCGVPMIEC